MYVRNFNSFEMKAFLTSCSKLFLVTDELLYSQQPGAALP